MEGGVEMRESEKGSERWGVKKLGESYRSRGWGMVICKDNLM